jgi:hypothetical protein
MKPPGEYVADLASTLWRAHVPKQMNVTYGDGNNNHWKENVLAISKSPCLLVFIIIIIAYKVKDGELQNWVTGVDSWQENCELYIRISHIIINYMFLKISTFSDTGSLFESLPQILMLAQLDRHMLLTSTSIGCIWTCWHSQQDSNLYTPQFLSFIAPVNVWTASVKQAYALCNC